MSTILEESMGATPLVAGKTKRIYQHISDPTKVFVMSNDDITAGDGAKHDIINGKGKLANRTTCNVFRLLKSCGIPVAFDSELTSHLHDASYPGGFTAPKCTMLPYEVVVRRSADGSFIDRNPSVKKGRVFPKLLVEFFLKTKGNQWTSKNGGEKYKLVKDDPMIEFDHEQELIRLFYPGHTSEERRKAPKGMLVGQEPFLILPCNKVFSYSHEVQLLQEMADLARLTFLILEKAWQLQGRTLVDFKVEFGIDPNGVLLLADVVDNDSWRLLDTDGGEMSKQFYRDGGDMNEVTAKYRLVTELSERFVIPKQRIILWSNGEIEVRRIFISMLSDLLGGKLQQSFELSQIMCATHGRTAQAYQILQQSAFEIPSSVVIAYIGGSNWIGPVLAANYIMPVITVPATYEKFREDVWSSLRVQNYTPLMTVLEPANALLVALQILSAQSPPLYAALRFEQEQRIMDT